jgi:tetratricopeptide (TPR) repeat protein
LAVGCVLAVALAAVGAGAQTVAPGSDQGRILLLLPFDNRSGQPSLEWVREAAPDLLSRRFASAGFAPMSRTDRMYALDHLGLPQSFQPSRASALKLAQTLDTDSIVVGSFLTDGPELVVEARIVNVSALNMSPSITTRGPMTKMADVFDSLAWKLTRQLDQNFAVAEETFLAAGRDIRLDAYEQYIRGIMEPDQAERLAHLKKAVELNANFGSAWMALGREQYASQQYDQAATSFSKVGRNDPEALEAGFYRGLALIFSGNYPAAAKSFEAVARILPLAEVTNNEGVAVSRQGGDATDLFIKAATADPASADYHFNLAVSLNRHGQHAGALNELAQCLKLRPNDEEALSLAAAWKQSSTGMTADPLERIVRTFDATAFRQAAQMMDQVDSTRLAALPPATRALKLCTQAYAYLDRGLLMEAERLYRDAVSIDPNLADAHAGLAQVSERAGDLDAARHEARAANERRPTVEAWLVLARIDRSAGRMLDANREVSEALRLEPENTAAQQLQLQILAATGQKK